MTTPSDSPGLEDVIREHIRAGTAKIHTAIPAVVVAYTPATQKATVKIVVRPRVVDATTGAEIPAPVPPPTVPNLPVLWSSGAAGAWAITGPLLPGDPVWIMAAERSTDEWRTTGLPDNLPLDARRWAWQDAYVLPGGRPGGALVPLPPTAYSALGPVLASTPAVPLHLGSSAAIDFALKGTLFETDLATFLNAMSSWLSAFQALLLVMSTPGAPATWVPLVVTAAGTFIAATTSFQTALATFTLSVTGGAHRSLSVKVS